MTWDDFGGRVEPEARRLAYMLNTGNPNVEHQAAVQLSQDLYGLPPQAQVELVRSTQMYDANGLGAQLRVDPILNQAGNGRLYDTGRRDVRVVDQANRVDEEVAVMNGTNTGYRQPGYLQPELRFDVFAGISGCTFAERPWMDAGWREREFHERQNWLGRRNEWEVYDGRRYGHEGFVRPVIGAGVDIGPVHVGVAVPIIGGLFGVHRDEHDKHRDDRHRDEHDRDRNRERDRH